MNWWYAVVEARHELQNPTSPEKIRELGERLDLGPDSHVLDIASGKGGPALILAETFGCRLTCVERAPEFVAAAREQTAAAGLEDRIEIIEADAASYELGRYDAALCLGASFAYGGFVPTLERLRVAAPLLAVGEPYWCEWPLPTAADRVEEQRVDEQEWLPLLETIERAESSGVRVVSFIASSLDDWDRYESLHWLALDEWLRANPDHPQADEFRAKGASRRARYLAWERAVLGWAIFVCRS
ncbi:MAG TPA: methyltransferase domain-containing protein [Gaiellaceae bacterium]|nr:methyltransferase domain-containing protein [Gaiellaceae bacterium]